MTVLCLAFVVATPQSTLVFESDSELSHMIRNCKSKIFPFYVFKFELRSKSQKRSK